MAFTLHRVGIMALSFCMAVCLTATAQAGDRLDRIMKDKVVRVGTPGDYLPFSHKQQDGSYEGFDIDMINHMAKELGLKVEFVHTTWPTIQKDFESDKFDVAVGGLARTTKRVMTGEVLPPYAPFGKVALMRLEHKDRFTSVDSMNQPDVRVIKNPGGTNETFVNTHLNKAQVTTHQFNAEIPGLIAEGKGDIMITENDEAISHMKRDKRLYAGFLDKPLTPINFKGFWMQKDDPDFVRLMNYMWDLLDRRGDLTTYTNKWLK